MVKHTFLSAIAALCLLYNIYAQEPVKQINPAAQHWADSVFNTLTEVEKIGQLMILRCYSDKDDTSYYNNLVKNIQDYNVGGICFFKGDAVTQSLITNRFQKAAKTPLLITTDAEWGLQMRLVDDCMNFPKQMTLGAIQNDSLIYKMGAAIACQLRRIGVAMNFAPDADINNNPANPVINFRSFGEDKYNVANKCLMYMKGMQDNNVAAVAKHFPGHGDTDTDSHFDLPVIKHSLAHLDSIEIYPFKQLIDNGICGVMTAHLFFPQIDTISNLPSSLSYNIVTGLLRNKMNFKGLTITDGIDMKAIQKFAAPGASEAISINAGNDLQLLPIYVDRSVDTILTWVKEGKIDQRKIDNSCKKILYAKYELGVNDANNNFIDTTNIYVDLNNYKDKALRRQLFREAITVTKNDNSILPLDLNSSINTACIIISKDTINEFENSLLKYNNADFIYVNENAGKDECEKIITAIDKYKRIIVVVSSNSSSIQNRFHISDTVYELLSTLSYHPNSIICLIANPYLASNIECLSNYNAVVFGYEPEIDVFQLLPQCLFGAYPISGRLPVSVSTDFPVFSGINIDDSGVLAYPSDDEIAANYNSFNQIDSIIADCINKGYFPSCEIFVAHKGNVVYNKAFGFMTYDNSEPVNTNTIYDVASVTKVAATTLSIMRLQGQNIFDVKRPLSYYLPYLNNSNKSNLIIKEIMAHQAKLPSYINFQEAFYDETYREKYLRTELSDEFPIHVAENLYVKRNFPHFIYDSIAKQNLLKNKQLPKNHYLYSDLGFILLAKAIENATNTPFDEYVNNNFLIPMGLDRTLFKPIEKFSPKEIAPTEEDKLFRRQVVRGYVHDETTALQGGVSGHAGLFSTAQQLGSIMQMLLQKGYYGNIKYVEPEIIEEFTSVQYPKNNNRRGCGFDKPLLEGGDNGPVCKDASPSSFGQSGFTGCLVWADPDNDLVYIFLSNRVYPDVTNNQITKHNIRSTIHHIVYQTIKSYSGNLE